METDSNEHVYRVLIPARLTEAVAFLSGHVSDEDYPCWVRRLGVSFAKSAFPEDWRKSWEASPIQFLGGLLHGTALAYKAGTIPGSIPPEQISEAVEPALRETVCSDLVGSVPPDLAQILRSPELEREAASDVGAALSLPPQQRVSFFHGFLIGLDGDKAILAAQVELKKKARGKIEHRLLKAFLWLNWPEVKEQGSIPNLFDYVARRFQGTDTPHVAGDFDNFKRYCNRYGISFLKEQQKLRG